ncbi:hypothetical protein PsorP6_000559 [Peronosclerospora sorghi]|uniref:Uncharacterized protein n=1 Tax=Peronosclerospora sorghi TaxID=230839 RepID=A0ACC0WSI8_9STRA|nr:hypothetical protein PsorP6_000559 [Peronosclerospora sorghi]
MDRKMLWVMDARLSGMRRQTSSPVVARVYLEFWSVGKLPRILEASRATADPIKTLAVVQLNALVVHFDEILPLS